MLQNIVKPQTKTGFVRTLDFFRSKLGQNAIVLHNQWYVVEHVIQ